VIATAEVSQIINPMAAWAEEPAGSLSIELILERVVPSSMRVEVLRVLTDVGRALDDLRLVEANLTGSASLKPALEIFAMIRIGATKLLGFIAHSFSPSSGAEEAVLEAIDSVSFALKHELSRVFDCELAGITGAESTDAIRPQITRACGLLTTCFQQSFVILAQAFDPKLDGITLFPELNDRRAQATALVQDLATLVKHAQSAEKTKDSSSYQSLLRALVEFRLHTMRFLLPRDWETFEALSDELSAVCDDGERDQVLDRLARYLETLLGQVGLRSVLFITAQEEAESQASSK
jgi:hypothetical protein